MSDDPNHPNFFTQGATQVSAAPTTAEPTSENPSFFNRMGNKAMNLMSGQKTPNASQVAPYTPVSRQEDQSELVSIVFKDKNGILNKIETNMPLNKLNITPIKIRGGARIKNKSSKNKKNKSNKMPKIKNSKRKTYKK